MTLIELEDMLKEMRHRGCDNNTSIKIRIISRQIARSYDEEIEEVRINNSSKHFITLDTAITFHD